MPPSDVEEVGAPVVVVAGAVVAVEDGGSTVVVVVELPGEQAAARISKARRRAIRRRIAAIQLHLRVYRRNQVARRPARRRQLHQKPCRTEAPSAGGCGAHIRRLNLRQLARSRGSLKAR